MSHISTIELEIRDLDTLERACGFMGLQLVRNRKRFRWYQGEGFCDHVIEVPGAEYDIGVVSSGSGYGLQWDDWRSGGLEQRLGKGAGKLKQAYALERVRSEARRRNMRIKQQVTDDRVQLVLTV